MKILAVALAIYAAYLPAAWFVHRDYVPLFQPAGRAVELMPRFELDNPDRYVARSYVFGLKRFDPSQMVVYEDEAPMPQDSFWFTAGETTYVIRIRPVDGSDPRVNGRRYWVVAP
jgi:hypothetical protein